MAKGKYEKWLEPDGLILLEGWARDGLSKEQIAHNIGINVKTLYDWEQKYPPICNAIKKGKEVVAYEVENALYKRALGFEAEEVTTEVRKDAKGNTIEKHVKRVKKQVAPDTGAAIFLLKNLRPDMWREKQIIKHEGEMHSPKLDDIMTQLGGDGLDE
ncbi:MAG: helix-turn-helix domain-containing protein [Eubacteriales bacterium]|nr:helix-turn-helix domain-containing protein [Eubacteriales bacterium]